MNKHSINGINTTTHKAVRLILTVTILILGVLLVIATILDISAFSYFQKSQVTIHKFTEAICYTCLGFTCIVIGLERVLDLSKIGNTLNSQTNLLIDIERNLKSFHQFRNLKNYQDIYTTSIGLIEKTQTKMRALIYANQPKAPDWWNDKVSDILKEKDLKGKPIQFDLVICMKPTDISEEFFKISDQRLNIYQQKDVAKYFHRYILFMKKLIGHDCLIIDDQHFIINFPTIKTNFTQKGMLFENQHEIAKELANWFDEFAFRDLVTYEELKNEFEKKQNRKSK